MIELIITTTTFSIMIMLFKYFDKIQVNNLIAITFNYFTAGILALLSFSKDFNLTEIQDSITITYIFLALLVGLFFDGKGFINLDHGLLNLLLYPNVKLSSSEISNPKLNVGNTPVSSFLISSLVVI